MEILNARVKQKVATEQEWLADNTILLEGEQAFVVNPVGAPVNFKIGDGTKTFSELPYYFDYGKDSGMGGVVPDTSFVPDIGTQEAPSIWFAAGGTPEAPVILPGFGGISLTNPLNVISWNGSAAVVKGVPVEVPEPDLTPYALKTEVSTKLNSSDVKGTASANLFDKDEQMRMNTLINSSGVLDASTGSVTTMDIDLDPTATHMTFSGYPVPFNRRVSYINASGQVTQTSAFTFTDPTTIEIDKTNGKAPVKWRVYFKNSADSNSIFETFMVNYGQTALPYTPYSKLLTKVGEFDVPVVNYEDVKQEVLNLAVAREEVKTKITAISNQRYDFSQGYINGRSINASGTTSASTSGSFITHPLRIPLGVSHVAVSGMTPGVNHGITFSRDTAVTQIKDFVRSTLPERIEEVPWDDPEVDEPIYVSVWFRNASEPVENIPGVLSDFMIAFSDTYLPKDDYFEKYEVYEIGGEAVFNQSDMDKYATKQWVEDNFSDGGSGIAEVPKRIDDRYRNDFKVKELVKETQRYNNTLQSLRKIKQSGSGEKSFNIPNDSGIEQTDVTLILNLHYGNQQGTSSDFDLFMDELCSTDFSDIRFLDANDNLLDIYKESSGNYETVIDTTLKLNMALLSNNDLIGTDTEEQGVFLSSDSAYNWVQIKPTGMALGGNANNDIFYSKGNNVYRSTKASNYADETMVLSDPLPGQAIEWRAKSFAMDDSGHLYLGQYQGSYGAVVFKSENGGDGFFKCYESVKQHVHSILVDKSTVPNTVYVNCDGSLNTTTGANRGTVVSDDRGATWSEIDFGYLTDSGVLYIDPSGYTLGGGESAIKMQPSISKRYADGSNKTILDIQQNTFQMQKLGNLVFVGGTVHSSNRYAKIYVSGDNAESFKTAFSSSMLKEGSMSWGYRYGLFGVMPAHAGNESMLLWSSAVSVLDNLRIFQGGNHYQGLFYVKVPLLPVEGITLKVGYGYLAEDIEGGLLKDNPVTNGRILHLPLNEYGRYVYDNLGNEYKIDAENNWTGLGKRYGWMVPFKRPSQVASIRFTNTGSLAIPNTNGRLSFNKNFTVNVWTRMENTSSGAKRFLFGRVGNDSGNQLFFARRGNYLGIQYGSTYKEIPSVYREDFKREFIMLTIVVTEAVTPDFRIFINGSRHNLDEYNAGTFPLDGFSDAMAFGDWMIGGLYGTNQGVVEVDESLFTDFSLFNRALTDTEIKILYEGANLFRP